MREVLQISRGAGDSTTARAARDAECTQDSKKYIVTLPDDSTMDDIII